MGNDVFFVRTVEEIFPYEEFRKHQRSLIDFIYNVFTEGKVGVVHAPTGIGKTISVLTAHMLEPNDKLLILTRTKNQASIYAKELKKISERLGEKIPYVFIRSKKDLCALADRIEKIQKLPYMVFIKICEKLKQEGRCGYYNACFSNGEFSEKLTDCATKLHNMGATSSRIIRFCSRRKLCPYEVAKYLARTSNIIVGTYSYLFNQRVRERFLSGIDMTLDEFRIVVDEAHNLPSFIESQNVLSINILSLELVRKKLIHMSTEDPTLRDIVDAIDDFLEKIQREAMMPEQKTSIIDISDAIASIDSNLIDSMTNIAYTLLQEETYHAATLLRFADFVEYYISYYTENTHVSVIETQYSKKYGYHQIIKIHLLDPSMEAINILKKAKSVILMSGSLHPLEYYKISLGLSEPGIYERTSTSIFPSPFPWNAIRVYVDVSLTSRYEERSPEMFEKYAHRIEIISNNLPMNKAILVLFPSYHMQREITERITIMTREKIIEHKETRIGEVKQFLRDHPNSIIFSVSGGKLAEGIDYRIDDKTILQAVIIAGLPFPEYNIILQRKQKYYEEKFGDEFIARFMTSIAPMVRTVIQAAGRLIRSEHDRGVVFILDRRFSNYAKYFPRKPWQIYEPYKYEHTLREILRMTSAFLST